MKHTALCRIVLLLLALVLMCGTFTACSASRPIKSTEQELKVVATCAGYDILYDELRYITLAYRDEYTAKYGADTWTDETKISTYLPQLTEEIIEALKINAAILSVCAEFGISAEDQDILTAVQTEMDEMIEMLGGRSAYKQMLEEMYMTDRFVRYTLATDLCESALNKTLSEAELIIANELDFMDYAMQDTNMCATYHIFIGNDEGDSIEENRATAEEVHAMLTSGTDIKQLIGSKYNEDVTAPSTPYYFMKTEYDERYESAAFALEIGEISEVVETDDGFYIIVRQPLSESYIAANLTELFQRYQYAQVESILADERAALTVEWTDYGRSLDLVSLS